MNSMQSLPIDSVPCFCPTWDEIKDKAHHYKTARIRATGEYVGLRAVSQNGFFLVPVGNNTGLYKTHSTEELCDFCL